MSFDESVFFFSLIYLYFFFFVLKGGMEKEFICFFFNFLDVLVLFLSKVCSFIGIACRVKTASSPLLLLVSLFLKSTVVCS